ncbi:uncharacterized protein LOC128547429 isoform X2 [Mercenaria mercenaria]|uniref:uncharacterized protein LOC128547429 isoform X2 n=1 Tax=Mercenaria mercenaria TaxID=6596 RepID=UPI00234F9315|nr:uncharacterized protein LOC128547429 isoform X2 [Mercenaria mercenaria]
MDIDVLMSDTIEIPSLQNISFKMSKREHKFYVCVHAPCSFKTDKRKAIYTHLVRTHNERKEDYECEYCSSKFELDSEIERHLHVHHPQQPFTYTCVSRIEKVINNCAKLGSDLKRPQTPIKSAGGESSDHSKASIEKKTPPKTENVSTVTKPPYLKPNISMRTRASVNESLNNIAKLPKYSTAEEEMTSASAQANESFLDEGVSDDEFSGERDEMEEVEIDTDEEAPTYISKPSGLKIKLSLKKGSANTSRDASSERSDSPPLLEPSAKEVINPTELPDDTPPDIIRNHPVGGTAQVRIKDSKYYDKLEVYHHTDEFGRRCCPFCDYKTSKNTIRVHLSGIHKIHFVKCSLCDYKAAFPHQITQHGIKFHKTTNLNVIQLSKESRDKTIGQLKRVGRVTLPVSTSQNDSVNKIKSAEDTITGNEIIDDEDFNSEESYPTSADENESSAGQADDRVFKPPKCQTSKTDYYSIRIENGVYLYSCNLCTFQTPVRATIYTHKYRHEEKSYRCGYCDFTSAPRSNVVHHCRVKHKGSPVNVVENDFDESAQRELKETVEKDTVQAMNENIVVKTEPIDEVVKSETNVEPENANFDMTSENTRDNITASQPEEKRHQTIIKVPQFKRSITSASYDAGQSSVEIKRPKVESDIQSVEYKLSLNKLYRINPTGSPKFMCALCSYACDTHPKMKHHLYRHRPQKYKCPYCDHRKYPRSYVVRHVRDTHRNKPVRVIDLSKGNEPEDIPEYMTDGVTDDTLDDTAEHIDPDEAALVQQQTRVETNHVDKDVVTGNSVADDTNAEQNEEVNALKNFAQKLNLRSVMTTDLNDDIFMQSSDVSPNFSDYTSSPLIESFINGQYQNSSTPKLNSKNFEKKKSLKDYRVNYGHGPRYICNKCGYGTENYKTIHNHMYRHESQRYQCPYCGYRRSPKSFVENHIREVHKGHPVIVTELTIDQEMTDAPVGSPRQCVTLKRKDPPQEASTSPTVLSAPTKVQKLEENVTAKIPVKWPAPKPVFQVNITQPQCPVSPVLKEIVEAPNSNILQLSSPVVRLVQTNMQQHDAKINAPTLAPVAPASPASQISPGGNNVRFVERNRTTFKTMYKCVFDPETCNHISKDKSKMKQHLFMHVEYKPWTCDFCDMTASQSSHIKNHVRTEHPGVPETSFKYKRHNYLEKHIEGFLTKGLFTVPVNEYRAIMDMKGNTKSSKQPTFDRDEEGNLLCPYCSYRTKSGGMTDHVKMKHMQPRFKCHWCEYRAFYRSEVRKHHRKEKSHVGLEFKTQELDLVQVMEGYKEKNGDTTETDATSTFIASSVDARQYLDDEDDDDDDDDDGTSECSSSEGSSIGDYQQGYVEYTTEQLSELCTNRQTKIDQSIESEKDTDIVIDTANKQVLLGALNTEVGPDGSMTIVQKNKPENTGVMKENSVKESKFKCGYCLFSADLRVKVKMHCSKKHPDKVLEIIEPSAKPETVVRQDNLDLDADDWKGTKFEQDLRRAGVSKLNLASLFPHSKRFQKSDDNDKDVQLNPDQGSESPEFKKPLEPISKVKTTDKKIENTETKVTTVVNVDRDDEKSDKNDKCPDNQEAARKSAESPKRDTNTAKSNILISDVRSLKQDADNKSKTEEVPEEQYQESDKSPNVDELKTTLPNHTTVILDNGVNSEVMNRSEEECVNDNMKTDATEEQCDTNQNSAECTNDFHGKDDFEEKEFVNDSTENGSSSYIPEQDCRSSDSIILNNAKNAENVEQEKNVTESFEKETMQLMNGYKYAIDGTLKENYELESNDSVKQCEIEPVAGSDKDTQSNLFKLDGTSERLLDMKSVTSGIKVNAGCKTTPVIDLPESYDSTCAMKEICDET